MDRLFTSKAKKSRKQRDATEFFPRNGGAGTEVFPAYEPVEVMPDSSVPIPEDTSLRSDIQRAIRRVALRSDTDSVSAISLEVVPDGATTVDRRVDAAQYYSTFPPAAGSDLSATTRASAASDATGGAAAGAPGAPWSGAALPDVARSVVPLIRECARRSVVLLPVDNLIDSHPQLQPAVLVFETFCLMVCADLAARVVQIVCKPAVLVLRLVRYCFS